MNVNIPKRHEEHLKYYFRLYSETSPSYEVISDDGTTVVYSITNEEQEYKTPTQQEYDNVVAECDNRLREKIKQDILDTYNQYSKVKLQYEVVNSDIIPVDTLLSFEWDIVKAHEVLINKAMNGNFFEYNIPDQPYSIINIPRFFAEYFCENKIEIYRTGLTYYRYDLYNKVDSMNSEELQNFDALASIPINSSSSNFSISNYPILNVNEAWEELNGIFKSIEKTKYTNLIAENNWCKVVLSIG